MSVEKESSSPEINQQTMIQYLLGELPSAWQEQFEARFFTDKESFEQLKRVEDQLVDDYVSQVLSDQQRERFESYYLNSDRRRQKLKFAQTLKQSLAELEPLLEKQTNPSFWQVLKITWQRPASRYSFVGVAIVVLVAGGWLLKTAVQLQKQRPEVKAEPVALALSIPTSSPQPSAPAITQKSLPDTSSSPMPLPSPRKQVSGESDAKTMLSLVLAPGAFRDDEATTRTLAITPQTKMISLRLALKGEETYSAYRIVLETASSQIILTRSGLRPVQAKPNNFIVLKVPAQSLPAEDYILTLSGRKNSEFEEIEDYQFRIVKRL